MQLPDHIWEPLAKTLRAEPKIDSTRNTAQNLMDLYKNYLCVVLMYGDTAVGFIAVWPVADGFYEIGSVWVCKSKRRLGLSKKLYNAVAQLPSISSGTAFGITTNPISVKVGESAGLKMMEDWSHPVPFHLTCGPCEYTPPDQQHACNRRNTSCWLRVIA
ncbi:MAG: GNAT family N-acetyltransferase [bacterium]|jgi:hypothetical protein|nr:GNAT family N-acetyltransferase [bacterium]